MPRSLVRCRTTTLRLGSRLLAQARWARLTLCVALVLALVGASRGAEAAPASPNPAPRTSAVDASSRPSAKVKPGARHAKVHVPHTRARKAPHATKARAVRHSHSKKHGGAKKAGGKHGNAAHTAPVHA
jgi:hypothetical protein